MSDLSEARKRLNDVFKINGRLAGRAGDLVKKHNVIEAIMAAWLACPELRLGQLMACATTFVEQDIFSIEDHALAHLILGFAEQYGNVDSSKDGGIHE